MILMILLICYAKDLRYHYKIGTNMVSLHVNASLQSFLMEHSCTVGLATYFTSSPMNTPNEKFIHLIRSVLVEKVEQIGGRRVAVGLTDSNELCGEDRVDGIVVDEFPSGHCALVYAASLSRFCELNGDCVRRYVALVVLPTPLITALTYFSSYILSRMCPAADTKAARLATTGMEENRDIWAASSHLISDKAKINDPVYVYNLNKLNSVARYRADSAEGMENPAVTGRVAFRRYKTLIQQLRRGAHVPYAGSVLGAITHSDEHDNLLEPWDDFILAHFPSRGALAGMLSSAEHADRAYHRDAALERAVVFVAQPLV